MCRGLAELGAAQATPLSLSAGNRPGSPLGPPLGGPEPWGALKTRADAPDECSCEQSPTYIAAATLDDLENTTAMANKGFPDLKKQVEGAAQEAVTAAGAAAGAAAQQVVDQATEAGQKAMDQMVKTTQDTVDKTASQASESFSGFGKKFGLSK